jgi:hypothetical protein
MKGICNQLSQNLNSYDKEFNKYSESSETKSLKKQAKAFKKDWKKEEDIKILELVQKYGNSWKEIAKHFKDKTYKMIRNRYINYLKQGVNLKKFSQEEDEHIAKLYFLYGAKWASIAKESKGRTADMIKNRFYSKIKKNLDDFQSKVKLYYIANK